MRAPGELALISLTLNIPETLAVGKAVGEISYPGKILVFEEARRGLSAEAVGAQVTAVTREPNGDNSTVEVTVAAKEGEKLPRGVIAELLFQVAADAPTQIGSIAGNCARHAIVITRSTPS